jgi:hypothetical protein
MDVFAIDNLQLGEIKLLRQSLDIIDIKGASAIFVANLQLKLDGEIRQIETMLQEEEAKKVAGPQTRAKSTKAES